MPSTAARLIAIGDIHGHAVALRRLVSEIQPKLADTIVVLGDCVNRGPDSRGVLECLIELQQQCHLVPILGNHDEMMLDSRNDPHAAGRWLAQGGTATLLSYGERAELVHVPDEHWSFLAGFRPYHETNEFIFTHANYCWYTPMHQQPESLLRWLALDESPPCSHISGKTVILGHTPGPVRDMGHYRCIDTGCGLGGVLTAMDVVPGECWQVTESGNLVSAREDQLG